MHMIHFKNKTKKKEMIDYYVAVLNDASEEKIFLLNVKEGMNVIILLTYNSSTFLSKKTSKKFTKMPENIILLLLLPLLKIRHAC